MDDVETWVRAVVYTNILTSGLPDSRVNEEPGLLVQIVVRNAIVCDGPIERFSLERPALPHSPSYDDLRPIDVLYGSYDPKTRSIAIYTENIRADAHMFGAQFEELLTVVRIHEYSHAVAHLGIRSTAVSSVLEGFGNDKRTDWPTFLEQRATISAALDSQCHETLAQAITYACLTAVENPYRSDKLRRVFDELEKKQPSQYHVPEDIKAVISGINWPIALDVVRNDSVTSFAHRLIKHDALLALLRAFGPPTTESHAAANEWGVGLDDTSAIADLHTALTAETRSRSVPEGDASELLVDRFHGLKVEIFAREHPPPHFRIVVGGETANYRIADCAQLNGGLAREYRAIRKWHAANKEKLIAAWNEHRPSDCPVGQYRVS